MAEELPQFKYHRDPVKSGVFEESNEKCPSCGKKRGWIYTAGFYSTDDVENLCPWCIADGSAAQKFDGTFIDDAGLEDSVSEDALEELVERTPDIISWQTSQWPVHCHEPCRFEAYVGTKELKEGKIDVKADLEDQAESYGLSLEEFQDVLENEGSIQGYLFQCVKCGKYRLTTDCD